MDELKTSLSALSDLLTDRPATGRRRAQAKNPRMYQTLNSFLINLLRNAGHPVRVEDLNVAVQNNIKNLRRSDGSNYKGDLYKILIGVLSNCSAFTETSIGWTIDSEKARAYEESTQKNINRRLGKYRIKSYDEKKTAKLFQQRVKASRCHELQDLQETCEAQLLDPDFSRTLQDPMQKLLTVGSVQDAEKAFGKQRLAGMTVMFQLLQENGVLQGLQGDSDLGDVKRKVTKLADDLQDVEKWLNYEDDLLGSSLDSA